MDEKLYWYKSKVKRIIDGDTIEVDISLGFEVWLYNQHVRLYGINAPEVRGKEKREGLVATAYLMSLLKKDDEILIKTHKDKRGSFGRMLVEIYKDGKCINDEMVKAGMAVSYLN